MKFTEGVTHQCSNNNLYVKVLSDGSHYLSTGQDYIAGFRGLQNADTYTLPGHMWTFGILFASIVACVAPVRLWHVAKGENTFSK